MTIDTDTPAGLRDAIRRMAHGYALIPSNNKSDYRMEICAGDYEAIRDALPALLDERDELVRKLAEAEALAARNAEDAREVDAWIACSERLPEVGQDVLVLFDTHYCNDYLDKHTLIDGKFVERPRYRSVCARLLYGATEEESRWGFANMENWPLPDTRTLAAWHALPSLPAQPAALDAAQDGEREHG